MSEQLQPTPSEVQDEATRAAKEQVGIDIIKDEYHGNHREVPSDEINEGLVGPYNFHSRNKPYDVINERGKVEAIDSGTHYKEERSGKRYWSGNYEHLNKSEFAQSTSKTFPSGVNVETKVASARKEGYVDDGYGDAKWVTLDPEDPNGPTEKVSRAERVITHPDGTVEKENTLVNAPKEWKKLRNVCQKYTQKDVMFRRTKKSSKMKLLKKRPLQGTI